MITNLLEDVLCQPKGKQVTQSTNLIKTFNNGSLGSRIDEERSELR